MRIRYRAAAAALLSLALVAQIPPASPVLAAVTRATPAPSPSAVANATPRRINAMGTAPARPTLPVLDPRTVRAVVTTNVRPAHGIAVAGPPMLGPHEIDKPIRAARERQRLLQRNPAPFAAAPNAVQSRTVPGAGSPHKALGALRAMSGTVGTDYGAGTGINPWWRYQEENVPGAGHLMINIGTGNYLVDVDDMAVPHKGVALAYRRTYNSQSGHDVAGSDGTPPSLYGNGWTSTWDAHLSGDATHNVTVWDIDGGRYNYTIAADGVTWQQPAGQHALLTSDGACGFLWTKKSGTTYYFNTPARLPGCTGTWSSYAGYAGRIYQIIGRNRNTTLTFSYVWDAGDASATGKITNVTAVAESGMQSTMVMADFNGHRLAASLNRPDGTVVYYGYDNDGNLTSVGSPPNNSGSTLSYEIYGYATQGNGARYMSWAASPRWAGSGARDGSYVNFGAEARGNTTLLLAVGHVGFVNPQINDGTASGVLQPTAPTGLQQFLTEYYNLETTNATFNDTDGHMTSWTVDGAGRPLQTQECTASQGQQCTGIWLKSTEFWDQNNNLVADVDARGYETDYAYDGNGNAVAVGEPSVTAQTNGGPLQLRPTRLYSYDQYNNVVAYCDQTWSQKNGKDWDVTGNPGSSSALCPSALGSSAQPGATVMTYAYPSWEPFGEVTAITTPMGYQRTISYVAPGAGTDYGLPVAVTGTPVTQVDGSTPLQLKETFSYDASGDLVAYGTGNGTWNLTYDALNRLTSATDPDGHASYTSYFPGGVVSKTETAAQRAANDAKTYSFDAGVLHTYDLDGDELTQVHHHGNVVGTTQNWYDGADRLVEVALPGDSTSSPVYTRYLYDLSGGGSVAVGGISVRGYGNLYDTKEYTTPPGTSTAAFVDARGQGFDALDRPVSKIALPPNTSTMVVQTALSYDATSATLGLLASTADAVGEITRMTYDALGRKTDIAFSNDGGTTPHRTYTYDPNGRPAIVTSDAFGTQTSRYDADGRLTSVAEPSGGGVTSPAVIGYDYYPDGHRKDLTVQSSALSAPATAPLMTYMYRADGKRTALTFAYAGASYPFTWTYTNAGRPSYQTDPYTGAAVPHPAGTSPPAATYAAKHWTYDANGDVRTLSLPVIGQYQQMTHDLEGALSGYGVQPSNKVGSTAPPNFVYQFTLNVNAVGESTEQDIVNPAPQAHTVVSQFSYSNGHAIPYPGNLAGSPHSGYVSYDLLNGVRAAQAIYGKNSQGGLQCPNPNLTTEQYDNSGRHIATNADLYDDSCNDGKYTDTNTYDAENHPVQTTQTGAVASDVGISTWGLQWGPNGIPSPYIRARIQRHSLAIRARRTCTTTATSCSSPPTPTANSRMSGRSC